jgi:hypothetical protein
MRCHSGPIPEARPVLNSASEVPMFFDQYCCPESSNKYRMTGINLRFEAFVSSSVSKAMIPAPASAGPDQTGRDGTAGPGKSAVWTNALDLRMPSNYTTSLQFYRWDRPCKPNMLSLLCDNSAPPPPPGACAANRGNEEK